MKHRYLLIALLASLSLSSLVGVSFALSGLSRYVRIDFSNIHAESDAVVKLGIRNLDTKDVVYFGNNETIFDSDFAENGHPTDIVYRPVSQAFNYEFFSKDEASGKYPEDVFPGFTMSSKLLPGETHKKATQGFRQYELFFNCDEPIKIKLGSRTGFQPDVEKNRILSKNYGLNLSDLNNVHKSLRFSILTEDDYFTVEPYKKDVTYLGGRLKDSGEYYNVGKDLKEIVYGDVDKDKLIYETEPLENDIGEFSKDSVFVAKSRKGTYRLDEKASIDNGAFREENSVDLKEMQKKGYFITNYKIDENKNVIINKDLRIVVSLYFEGWDRDNNNTITYGCFNSQLQFVCDYAYEDINKILGGQY